MRIKIILRAIFAATTLQATTASAQSVPPLTALEQQASQQAASVQRLAVVFGLGRYVGISPLSNTINDARAVAAMLRSNGFLVIEGYDLDKLQFEAMLRDTVMAGGGRSEVLFYFAGHGIQIGARSHLLPTDARLSDPYDVPFQTVSLDGILDTLGARSQTQLAFLDACRNNPFEGRQVIGGVRGTGLPVTRGFSTPRPPSNTLLAFSTAPGALALDGTGPNSPYTSALLGAAQISPDSDIEALLSAVSRLVEQNTGGRQRPTHASALARPFTLRPPPMALVAPSVIPTAPVQVAVPSVSSSVITAPTAAVGITVPSLSTGPRPSGVSSVTAPRERVIGIGERLLQAISFDPGARIRLFSAPVGMAFGLLTRSGSIADVSGDVPVSRISALVLRPTGVEAQGHSQASGVVTSQIVLEATQGGAGRMSVPVSIVPDRCDVEAGDWFDPQGVGLYRFDSALRADATIAACQAALARQPGKPRYLYQLARGLQAAGRLGEAEARYRQAADAGHARAWLGYGQSLAARGDVGGAAAAFERGDVMGDPRAAAALGDLRLRNARTEAERQSAYEMLTKGVDLGLWDAMDSLGRYYANPSSPDHDPLRARRYQSEAALRRSRIPVSNVTPSTQPLRQDEFERDRGGDNRGGERR